MQGYHRFLTGPKNIAMLEKPPGWLVEQFRELIGLRANKEIDYRIRLVMVYRNYDITGPILVEGLWSLDKSQRILASAYVKAAELESSGVWIYVSHSIPWERLKQFRASEGCVPSRRNGRGGEAKLGGRSKPPVVCGARRETDVISALSGARGKGKGDRKPQKETPRTGNLDNAASLDDSARSELSGLGGGKQPSSRCPEPISKGLQRGGQEMLGVQGSRLNEKSKGES